MPLPDIDPLELQEIRSALDDPAWLYEIKFDGGFAHWPMSSAEPVSSLVALAVFTNGFADLRDVISAHISGQAILDVEILVLDAVGRTLFYEVMRTKAPQYSPRSICSG